MSTESDSLLIGSDSVSIGSGSVLTESGSVPIESGSVPTESGSVPTESGSVLTECYLLLAVHPLDDAAASQQVDGHFLYNFPLGPDKKHPSLEAAPPLHRSRH